MLIDLFLNHKKSLIHKYEHHIRVYDEIFAPFRGKPVCVLEIGVAQGGSLQLWRDYFGPDARIMGIDVQGSFGHLVKDNIEVIIGNAADPGLHKGLKERLGQIDILIDDGSHECPDQIAAFEGFFPFISDGGLYVCEDIHTSYRWTHHGGYKKKGSFIEYMKDLVDYFHVKEFKLDPDVEIPDLVNWIESITFYRGLLAVKKDVNAFRVNSPLMIEGRE